MVVRGWLLGTATDVCSAWIWTCARHASSVSSHPPTAAKNVPLGRTHQCSRSVTEHVFRQAAPSLRAMRTITRWSTWSTPATTARASSSAAGSTATSVKTLTSALVATMQKNILTGKTLGIMLFSLSIPFLFSNQTFPYVATCPLIGSQCTPWSPYGSAIATG